MTVFGAILIWLLLLLVDSSWNVMAHGDAREGKWRGNWRMEWLAGTLHTTSEHGVSSITTADAQTSTASSWLNWCPRQFEWTSPFRQKNEIWFLCVRHHISTSRYKHFACSGPTSDDSLRGCRTFQRMLGVKLVSVCTVDRRKESFFFSSLCSLLSLWREHLFFLFSPQITKYPCFCFLIGPESEESHLLFFLSLRLCRGLLSCPHKCFSLLISKIQVMPLVFQFWLVYHWITWNHLPVTHLRASKIFSSPISRVSFRVTAWSTVFYTGWCLVTLPLHTSGVDLYVHTLCCGMLWHSRVMCGNTVIIRMCISFVMVLCMWHTVLTCVSAVKLGMGYADFAATLCNLWYPFSLYMNLQFLISSFI